MRFLSALVAFVLTATLATSSLASDYPHGKLPEAATPIAYRLDLTIIPEKERFSGHTEIDITLNAATKSLFMHGRDLKVSKSVALVNGKTIKANFVQLDDLGVARIEFAQTLPKGKVTLIFDYDAPFADGPAGMYHIKSGDDWYVWTQFESIDARAAFPSFDEPGYKTPFSVTLTTKPDFLATSNAKEIGQTKVGDLVKHDFETTKPLPTYLVAFVVGPFVSKTIMAPPTPQRSWELPIRVIGTKTNADKLDFAVSESPKIVALLENYFDSPFPFPKLDQIGSPVMPGAMENAGADIYGDDILFLEKQASVAQQQAFGMVVAHELAHQWFGDLATPTWWDDIWLNESFANWMGFRIGNEWRPDLNIGVNALQEGFAAMDTDALSVGRPIRESITDNGDIDGAFDEITYGKGGHVVAMIAAYMGDEAFQKGVQLHMKRYAYKNATTDQFFSSLADSAGDARILNSMKGFIEQQGVPVIELHHVDDQIIATQSRFGLMGVPVKPQTWIIPVCVRRGETRSCTLMDQKTQVIAASGAGAIMPNAGGTGYYRFALEPADWNALIHDGLSLTAGEGLSAIDSLEAQFGTGDLSPEMMIEAARLFVNHPDADVATELGGYLSGLKGRGMISEAAMPHYRKLMGDIYGPRLKALGFDVKVGAFGDSTPNDKSLRQSLTSLMAFEAKDPEVRAALNQAAAAYLGGDKSALAQGYMGSAMAVYVDEGGIDVVKTLFARLLTEPDERMRSLILRSLTSDADATTAQWLMDQFSEKKLRKTDKLSIIAGLMYNPKTRDMAYNWIVANYDDMTASGGIFSSGRLAALPGVYCSTAKADEVDTFLRPKVIAAGRGDLSFNRMLEGMRTCGILKDARGQEVSKSLEAIN